MRLPGGQRGPLRVGVAAHACRTENVLALRGCETACEWDNAKSTLDAAYTTAWAAVVRKVLSAFRNCVLLQDCISCLPRKQVCTCQARTAPQTHLEGQRCHGQRLPRQAGSRWYTWTGCLRRSGEMVQARGTAASRQPTALHGRGSAALTLTSVFNTSEKACTYFSSSVLLYRKRESAVQAHCGGSKFNRARGLLLDWRHCGLRCGMQP